MSDPTLTFGDTIATIYESHMVPMVFQPYADDMARRVALVAPERVLEIASGTGVVTRALARALPDTTEIAGTDLNPAMLDVAARAGTSRPVHWQQADVMALPFDDRSADAMVCQFGVMFFPDKAKAFAEMRRVLEPGGTLWFSVWDRIETNELAHAVVDALAGMFPDDPPDFISRVPHGYFDPDVIGDDLRAGGFAAFARYEAVDARSRAASARDVAIAYCQGTPMRLEIEKRDRTGLAAATDAVEAEIASRFGAGPIDAGMRAHVVRVMR